MALRDSFVNIAKNAAAGAAQSFVSGVADGLRSGLGGSSSSSASSPLQTSFQGEKPILQYPSGLGTDGRNLNFMLFTPKKVDGTGVNKNLGSNQKKVLLEARSSRSATAETVAKVQADQAAAAKKATETIKGTKNSIYKGTRTFVKTGRTIALYMPPQLNVSYGMEYSESEISGASEILYGLFKGFQNTGRIDLKGLQSGPAANLLKDQATNMVNAVPGLGGARDLRSIELGAIPSPKMELMFRGVSRREFSFAFTFLPESKVDMLDVQEIIKEFKLRMHPKFDLNSGTRRQSIPDIFEIAYHHTQGRNLNLHRIASCFLKKMDVTYGGDQFQTFKSDGDSMDGAPVKTTMTLNFGEIELIDREMIKQGF